MPTVCTYMFIPQIEEAWNDHVVQLGRTISASTAVNTYFLFGRLFGVLRLQFSSLTREACNYLGEEYKTIASHFLVTTEFLLSQFEIPKVYIDADMVSCVSTFWCPIWHITCHHSVQNLFRIWRIRKWLQASCHALPGEKPGFIIIIIQ